jgi:DNA-binding CsgD family transcriptional regulator
MSYALHSGYEPAGKAPARNFLQDAPSLLHLDDMIAAFASAISAHQGYAHVCCATDEDGNLFPLFGDAPELAADTGGRLVESIDVETMDGEQLVVLIACRSPFDRMNLSRLRLLAVMYATHAVTLFDAADEEPANGQITAIEQTCFSLTMTGWSHLDIADRLDRSAPAIGIHMRRAAERLGVSTIAEASAIIASRGLISLQLPVGRPA